MTKIHHAYLISPPMILSTRPHPNRHGSPLPFSSMLLLLSLASVLVEAQIQVPECLPAAQATWNWVRVQDSFIIECLITASRHTTVSNRALVQQPATSPHNATTAVRPLFTNSSHQTHEKGVAFTIPQLAPGNHYTGPSGNDLCQCNTVIYSLISACAGCQNGTWMSCVRFFFILLHCP